MGGGLPWVNLGSLTWVSGPVRSGVSDLPPAIFAHFLTSAAVRLGVAGSGTWVSVTWVGVAFVAALVASTVGFFP